MDRFDLQRFITPADTDKPVYSWEWDCKLSEERIRKQLELMKAHDVHAFYILPIPPTFRPEGWYSELNVPYMSEEYEKYMRYTAEYAKELGMVMWLYDEPGYPSGHAGGAVVDSDPSTRAKWVEKREIALKANEVYRPKTDVIAAFCKERIEEGFCAKSDVTILEYYWDDGWRAKGYADLLEPKTTQRFIECTYDVHKDAMGDLFGPLIPYMFTDEPSVIGYPWPYDFAERFTEKYGYDIRDYMPLFIEVEKMNQKGTEACIHYHELISELFADRYFGTLREWCEKNNIQFVGHINNDNDIRNLKPYRYGHLLNIMRKFHVPGIDVIIRQIYPAEKPCEEGYGFFPRLASSAATQNGTKDALTESFGVAGGGIDFDLMRYVCNYQLIRGINILQFQILDSRENGCGRPLSGKEQPLTDYFPQFHTYAARVSYLSTLGESLADTALYIPVRDIFAADEFESKIAADFEEAGYELERMGIDFDLIDDTVIREAVKEGNVLRIGLAKYRNIIVPDCKYMPEDVQEKLKGMGRSVSRDLIQDSDNLRTKSRVLADGKKLVLVFNESIHEVHTQIQFPKMNYLYELELVNGEVVSCEYDKETSFFGGELKAFLLSDEEVESRAAYTEMKKTIVEGFEAAPVNTFYIDKNGTQYDDVEPKYQPVKLGAWEPFMGKEFSGKVSYKTEITVEDEACRAYCIDLGQVEFSATVRINGEDYGICSMTPKQVIIPYENMPKGKVMLEIIVANTVANQYAFADYEKYFTAMELGPYHQHMKIHEAEEAGGGLYGPVTISLLK